MTRKRIALYILVTTELVAVPHVTMAAPFVGGSKSAVVPSPEALPLSKAMPVAKLNAVDEITERIAHLDAPLNHPITFGRLIITVRACIDRAFDDPPDDVAFLQIDRIPFASEKGQSHRIFSGWMFTSSPSISTLDDPVYDVSLTGCQALSPKRRSTKTASSH